MLRFQVGIASVDLAVAGNTSTTSFSGLSFTNVTDFKDIQIVNAPLSGTEKKSVDAFVL